MAVKKEDNNIQRIIIVLLALITLISVSKLETPTGFIAYSGGGEKNSNLTIWDDTEDTTKYSLDQAYFYANYTDNLTELSINDTSTYCNITFNPSSVWETPEAMSFNSSTAQYEYNRTFNVKGTFDFNVTCDDDNYDLLDAVDNFTITNTAPSVEYQNLPNPISCYENSECYFNFSTNVSEVDTNDVLNYSNDNLYQTQCSDSISSCFESINHLLGGVNFTCTSDSQATDGCNVVFVVKDSDQKQASTGVNFVMNAVNDTPVFSTVPAQLWQVNTTNELNIASYVSDEENDDLYFIANHSSINITTAGFINFTTTDDDVEYHIINITVNDSYGNAVSQDIIINITNVVTINSIPTIDTYSPNYQDVIVYENTSNTTFSVYTTDVNDDILYYNWTLDDIVNQTGTGTDTGTNTGSDSWTYVTGFFDSGIHNLTIYVSDDENTTDFATVYWNITIENVNSPPSFTTIQNISWNQDTNYENLDLDNHFTDLENQSDLIFTWTQMDENNTELNSTNVNVSINSNNIIKFTPNSGWTGTEYINFSANDTEDTVESNIITLNVTSAVSPVTVSTPSAGGGGGGGRRPLIGIDIIQPKIPSIIENETIKSQLIIKNNNNIDLRDIKLNTSISYGNTTVRLLKDYIGLLKPNQEEIVDMIITAKEQGLVELIVQALVGNPDAKDTIKIYFNVKPKDIEERIKFVKDLFKEHPECLELNELLTKAEEALKNNQLQKSIDYTDTAITKCKDLITGGVKEEIKVPKKLRLTGLVILNLIVLVMMYYLVKRYKKRSEK